MYIFHTTLRGGDPYRLWKRNVPSVSPPIYYALEYNHFFFLTIMDILSQSGSAYSSQVKKKNCRKQMRDYFLAWKAVQKKKLGYNKSLLPEKKLWSCLPCCWKRGRDMNKEADIMENKMPYTFSWLTCRTPTVLFHLKKGNKILLTSIILFTLQSHEHLNYSTSFERLLKSDE